ncbi:MAG: hypothetical protein BWY90_01155 [Deltaproteobacteria bacterium ADurb.BinA014]|nr:MAG: hypothetical protein BWY90_01155 [Deltaproteobacteria bacterium ADurb.BinA014]
MVIAPFHRVIDADNCIADFRNTICRVDEVSTQILACNFSGNVRAVKYDFKFIGKATRCLFCFFNGFEYRFGWNNIFHLLVVKNQFYLFTFFIFGSFVIALTGFIAEPFILHHLQGYFIRFVKFAHLIIGHAVIYVLTDVITNIETYQINSPKNGGAGSSQGLADNGVYLFYFKAFAEHHMRGICQVKTADTIADKVRPVFADNHSLAQNAFGKLHHIIHNRFFRLFPGNYFQKPHIARRVEEVHTQKTLFYLRFKFRRYIFDGDTRCIRGYNAGVFHDFLYLGKKILLNFEIFHNHLNNQIDISQHIQIIFKIADFDHGSVFLGIKRGWLGFQRPVQTILGKPVAPRRTLFGKSFFLIRLRQLEGNDVQKTAFNTGISQMSGDGRSHHARS